MSATYYYQTLEKLAWTLAALGAGILFLILGFGYSVFVPQERPAAEVSRLEVLTGNAAQVPLYFTPLTQVILIVVGIISLVFAVLIYRTTSAVISIDEEAITYQSGNKIERIPWSEVTDVKKRVIAWRAGAAEMVTLVAKTDPYKITFKSTIKGYPELVKAVQEHTKIQF